MSADKASCLAFGACLSGGKRGPGALGDDDAWQRKQPTNKRGNGGTSGCLEGERCNKSCFLSQIHTEVAQGTRAQTGVESGIQSVQSKVICRFLVPSFHDSGFCLRCRGSASWVVSWAGCCLATRASPSAGRAICLLAHLAHSHSLEDLPFVSQCEALLVLKAGDSQLETAQECGGTVGDVWLPRGVHGLVSPDPLRVEPQRHPEHEIFPCPSLLDCCLVALENQFCIFEY